MIVITVYALFFDDLRQIFFEKKDDEVFFGLTTVCLGFFLLEILLSSYALPDYFLSFFFWLDVVATVSLIGDIGWIFDNLTQASTDTTNLAKTSRAARVTRIIRVVRLVRLVRIVKLYKQARNAQRKNEARHQQEVQRKVMLMRLGTLSESSSVSPAGLQSMRPSLKIAPGNVHRNSHLRRRSSFRKPLIKGGQKSRLQRR